ncbi:macrolide family glycosyltransferase [Streptomyces sp. NBC_00328]|uniref:macrolide family glycosyltransferase n=1 Tax=Streptomyces sp. NBC_00328 TaxID=2903646 RepID=UPI002E2B07BD|nr:macrolide family glycosyltransferase [Streptomyces sp. NBC_00328]
MSMPIAGHLFPNLAVVEELIRRGHRVSFATGESQAEAVRHTGADVITYGSSFDDVKKLNLTQDRDGANTPLTVLKDGTAMLEEVKARLADDRPDLVLYDMLAFHVGRVLARTWGVPAVQLNPMFASNEHFSLHRAMHDAPPAADGGQEEQKPQALSAGMGEWFAALAGLLASHGVDTPPGEFLTATEELTLVYLPREFQYEGDTFDETFVFAGPCVNNRMFMDIWQPPADGLPVVLVSLGGIFNELPDFFHTIVRAFTDKPWHAVITVGNGIDPDELGPLPANIEVHRWVSHSTVLEHARLLVSHGGTGSVTESLSLGVPMVVIPQSSDTRPTARRVEELGLGRRLDHTELGPELLIKTVEDVAADGEIRANVDRMKEHMRTAGGTARAADALEAHLRRVVAEPGKGGNAHAGA